MRLPCRFKGFFSVMGLLLFLIGCGDGGDSFDPAAPSPTPTSSSAPSATLIFSSQRLPASAGMDGGVPQAESSFSISTLRELHIYTLWENVDGEHEELRKFYSPDGSLYYQKLLAFSTFSSIEKPFVTSQAVPRALMVQPSIFSSDGEAVVWDYLPVGGTWISEHTMTGIWRVEVFLDGGSSPAGSGSFALAD